MLTLAAEGASEPAVDTCLCGNEYCRLCRSKTIRAAQRCQHGSVTEPYCFRRYPVRNLPSFLTCIGVVLCVAMSGCVASSPKLQQADAVRRAVAHYRGPVRVENAARVSPGELVVLSSEKASDFAPTTRSHDELLLGEQTSWFLEPGILNEECPHCRERGGVISSEYGKRRDPVRQRRVRQHNGVDIRVPKGSAALAFRGGKVVRAGRYSTYGLTVDIRQYDGYLARYAHLNKIMTKVGAEVDAGIQIGEVGRTGRTTGPHLHFELIKDGESINPLNMLSRAEQVVRCNMLEASKEKKDSVPE